MLRIVPFRIVSMSLLCVSLVVQGLAQVHTASLTGLVTDPQGGVVDNALVTAKNKATNVEQTAKSDSSGYYTFATLSVGTYTLTVENTGFKKAIRDSVALDVGQKARLDFTLEVGAVTETVMVEAGTQLLTTQEASTGGVVENRSISNLPLAARNWDDLLAMVPGVQADRFTEQSGGQWANRRSQRPRSSLAAEQLYPGRRG
jgi:hypothetical protein